MDDIVRRIRRLPGNLPPSRFPDCEVLATRHDGSDFMLPNSIAMPMVLERMLQNEIPELLQIVRCDDLRLAREIERFLQPAVILRQKRLPFSVLKVVLSLRMEGKFLMARVNLYRIDLMGLMSFV